jgi:hypothetical protein
MGARRLLLAGIFLLGALQLGATSTARADVVVATPGGFTVRSSVVVPVGTAQAWKRFVAIAGWWNKDHTFSGNSANLYLTTSPGGCMCERLPGGGFVEHLRVEYADKGRMLRFSGALAPLQGMGVSGAYTLEFDPRGGQTEVLGTYVVNGFDAQGLDRIAPVVDQVMSGQLQSFAAKLTNR